MKGIWWASEERKTKKPRFVSKIWQASEEWKTKKPRFVRSGGFPKNENSKIRSGSGGFPKNENLKIRLGGLLTFRKRGTKIRKLRVGFRSSEKWNQDSSRVSRVSSEEWKKPKIRK
ncbi:unnamed protein product [Rhizophagus irregularis]|nr:unnamed protein product [Rhizophagus irregularis]